MKGIDLFNNVCVCLISYVFFRVGLVAIFHSSLQWEFLKGLYHKLDAVPLLSNAVGTDSAWQVCKLFQLLRRDAFLNYSLSPLKRFVQQLANSHNHHRWLLASFTSKLGTKINFPPVVLLYCICIWITSKLLHISLKMFLWSLLYHPGKLYTKKKKKK